MIGILPAAGEATRMHGIPKYLLPTRNGYLLKRHLEMMLPVVNNGVFIGTNGLHYEWITQNAPDAQIIDVGYTATMSETVLGLQRYAGTQDVLFGMPDTFIGDDDIYKMLTFTLNLGHDVAVAIFEARPEQKYKVGMLNLKWLSGDDWKASGWQVNEVIDKPKETELLFAWGALAWKPSFWQCIEPSDPHIGYALARSISKGLSNMTTLIDNGYWDCGTPDEYFALIRHLTEER